MKIVIIGAGSVGRSIALELRAKGRTITVIDVENPHPDFEGVEWVQGDAAEINILEKAGVAQADVLVAATGDDKVNLVASLLAKTEFGVPRTVARVNHPRNEWMFDDMWGVDVAVSTPRTMTALIEEAVSVGTIVRMFSFARSRTHMVEITIPETSPTVGAQIGTIPWPDGVVPVGIIREGHPIAPASGDCLEARDEVLFLASDQSHEALQRVIVPQDIAARTAALPVVRATNSED